MPLTLQDVVIESQRLRLLPSNEAFADDVFRNFTREIADYLGPQPPTAIDETLAFLRTCQEQIVAGTDLPVVILLKETGEFLGHAGIHGLDTPIPELGIWVKAPAHGNHYGREAITALSYWALEHLVFDYLKYPVDRRNVPSRRIPESLGGRIEAEYRLPNLAGTATLDLVEYRIYPDDLRRLREGAS